MGFTLKLTVLSATVVSTVVICKHISPLITDFATSELPTIWTSLTSWLKPPYLYVLINFIILTIAASSRLQSTEPVKVVLPVELPPTQEPQVLFHGGYVNDLKHVQPLEPRFSAPQFSDELIHEHMKVDEDGYKELEENIVNKSVISVSAWKPPVSAASRRRKRAKAMLEGVKTLGVSTRPKRQDTLESTWKAITEGRSTRHLRKSDTWNTNTTPNSEDLLIIDNNNNNNNNDNNNNNHFKRMTKSATFAEGRTKPPQPLEPQLSGCGESGRLSREPSLEQEELNRRVEAFINKVNENMRLQRQESLDHYMDMIKRGAY